MPLPAPMPAARRSVPHLPRRIQGAVGTVSILGVSVLAAGWFLRWGGTSSMQVASFWAVLAVSHLYLAVAAGEVARHAPPVPGFRRVWSAVVAGGIVFLIGDLTQLVMLTSGRSGPSSVIGNPVEQIALASGMIAMIGGVVSVPLAAGSTTERRRLRLDMGTVMVAGMVLEAYVVQVPSGPHDGRWLIGVVLAVLVAPALFLVALFAVVKVMLGGTPPISRPAGWLLAAAAVLKIAVQAGAVDPAATAIPAIMAGDVLAAGVMLASVVAQRRRTGTRSEAGVGRRRRPYSRLPYGALATTNAILVVALIADDRSWRLWAVLAGVLASFTLVVVRQMGALRDIATLLTERDALAASLREQAYRDALTGLPNRSRFIELLSAADTEVLVLFVDLNSFKPVNDEHGHAAGDELLIEVGRRLQQCVGAGATVARLGGDEYAVMVRDVPADRQDQLIDDIRAAIDQPFVVQGAAVRVGASVGAAHGHVADGGADALLHRADMAMYAQKKQVKYAAR